MKQVTSEILGVLEKNGIKKDDILDVITEIYKEIELNLWEKLYITPSILYNLKDIVWYNLEHLPNGGEDIGLSDLKHLGTVYPNFIYCFNDSNSLSNDKVQELLEEIDAIINLWNKNMVFVELYTKSNIGWNGGDNPSKVIIYDSFTESPTKYGYNKKYGNIIDVNGKSIKKISDDAVLCALSTKIGEYVNGQILYNNLIKIKQTCKRAISNNKNLRVEFEQSTMEY